MKSLGVCLGASTITFVEVTQDENNKITIDKITSKAHEGNAKQNFIDILGSISPEKFDRITVTGRKFRENVNLSTITEPEAIEYALIISIWTQTSIMCSFLPVVRRLSSMSWTATDIFLRCISVTNVHLEQVSSSCSRFAEWT